MSKHTPGPWLGGQAGNFRIYGPPNMGRQSGPVAEALAIGDPEVQRANARLISASPDLLEALEAVLKECQVAAPGPHFRWDDEYYEAFNQARAAFAKATETDR